jgi:hypothetical protein
VAAAADQLADPGARAELSALMADERARWERIRSLLAGSKGQGETPARPPHAVPQSANSLTIGSLRSGR